MIKRGKDSSSNFLRQEEKELIRQCQAGSESAFEEIYKRYKKMVYTVAYRMANERGFAEDVTQEVFISVYRKIKTFRFESSFSTWIYRLVINASLGGLRKKRDEIPIEDCNIEDKRKEEDSLFRTHLREAISKLPLGYREIFILHDIQGLQHEEIARILKCSVGNSKSQLFKAHRKLREILAPFKQANRAEV